MFGLTRKAKSEKVAELIAPDAMHEQWVQRITEPQTKPKVWRLPASMAESVASRTAASRSVGSATALQGIQYLQRSHSSLSIAASLAVPISLQSECVALQA
mmetsp:Transcript_41693/g.73210  ORF Transcript_41693/g.73210 Transcript_41693/m.73210 type:complete len:101 (-) Transcript_41693:1153-1455(-)